MNETLDLLLRRRSVVAKNLTEPGPDEDQLRTIIEAGLRVPDHGKLGPWRLKLIRGDARANLGEVLAQRFSANNPEAKTDLIEFERNRFTRAPTVIAVASHVTPNHKIPEWEQILSAGAVCQNMLVATHAMGFVGQWITEWYAYDETVKAALGFEPADRIAGFVYLGSCGEAPTERVRPRYEDVVSEWRGANGG